MLSHSTQLPCRSALPVTGEGLRSAFPSSSLPGPSFLEPGASRGSQKRGCVGWGCQGTPYVLQDLSSASQLQGKSGPESGGTANSWSTELHFRFKI